MSKRSNTSSGWPVIIAITVFLAGAAATVSYAMIPKGLVDLAWGHLLYRALPVGVAAAVAGFAAVLVYRNTQAPRAAVNAALLLLIAACLTAPVGVAIWQRAAQGHARDTALPVLLSVRDAIQASDEAYQAELERLGVSTLVEPDALPRGFNAASARTRLKAARDANVRHHAEVQAKIAEGRTRFQALNLGPRGEKGLATFDGEFTHKGAGPAQLKAYETYELDLLDFEVDFLAKNQGRWQAQGEGMGFATTDLADQYSGIIGQRRSNDGYLERLRRFNDKQAESRSFQ